MVRKVVVDVCPETQRTHAYIRQKHPKWRECKKCYGELYSDTSDSDESLNTEPQILRSVTIGKSKPLASDGPPKALQNHAAAAQNARRHINLSSWQTASDAVHQDHQRSIQSTAKPKQSEITARVGIRLYVAEWLEYPVGGIVTTKFTFLDKHKFFIGGICLINKIFINHAECIRYLFDKGCVDARDREAEWRFMGPITTGNGFGAQELSLDPSSACCLSTIINQHHEKTSKGDYILPLLSGSGTRLEKPPETTKPGRKAFVPPDDFTEDDTEPAKTTQRKGKAKPLTKPKRGAARKKRLIVKEEKEEDEPRELEESHKIQQKPMKVSALVASLPDFSMTTRSRGHKRTHTNVSMASSDVEDELPDIMQIKEELESAKELKVEQSQQNGADKDTGDDEVEILGVI
jgi:hypothetical protein